MPASRRVRALLALVVALLASLLPVAPTTGDTHAGVPGPVVLVGTPGLRWDDVSAARTPALWSLLVDGAAGTLAARSVYSRACPVDGWLAVSAGRRAADVPVEPGGAMCRQPDEPVEGRVPRWDVYAEDARTRNYQATPGLLADTLAAAGTPSAAVGPGAAVALAGADGRVVGEYRAGGEPDEIGRAVRELAPEHRLLVVDAGAVRDPEDVTTTDPAVTGPGRLAQAEEVDARVAAALDALPEGASVVVASLADSGRTPRLQLAAARGPAPGDARYADALLGSRSTRQQGIVQVTDLTPTLLTLLGVDGPAALIGTPIRPLPDSPADPLERLNVLLDLDAASQAVQPLVPWFFNLLVVAQIALYGAAALALRNQWGGPAGRHTVLAWLRRVSVLFAAVPVSTFLANLFPWWRADNDFLAVVAAVALFAVAVSLLALAPPWGRRPLGPFGSVAGLTALVLAADVVAGSRLITSSLMGLQPVVAGRFYGLGNVQYALFATGALLAATAIADRLLRSGRRRLAVVSVAAIGTVAVVVNGAPGLGSDFGGPPSMVPAFTLLALMVGGLGLTWRRVLLVAVGTVAVIAALSLVDWLRPQEQRTHLGRFVDTLLAGGAWPVIERKLTQNLEILTGSWLSLLVPFAALFVAVILMRPVAWGAPALQRAYERCPALRPGLFALIVMLAIGFAVNDSGTVVPAVGATLAIPLLIAASARVLELEDTDPDALAGGADAGRAEDRERLPVTGGGPDARRA